MLAPAAESEAARGALRHRMAALPWHQLSCHLRDETMVPALLQLLPRLPCTVQLICSRLDWLAYLTQLVAASGGLPRPQLAPLLQLTIKQDRCELLDSFEVGQEVEIFFDLRGREWTNPQGQVKYFNTLQAWKLVADQNSVNPSAPKPPQTGSDQIPQVGP